MKREQQRELRELVRDANEAMRRYAEELLANREYMEDVVKRIIDQHVLGMVGAMFGIQKHFNEWEVDRTNQRQSPLRTQIEKLAAERLGPLVEAELAQPLAPKWSALIAKARKSIQNEHEERVYDCMERALRKRAQRPAELEANRLLREEFAIVGGPTKVDEEDE